LRLHKLSLFYSECTILQSTATFFTLFYLTHCTANTARGAIAIYDMHHLLFSKEDPLTVMRHRHTSSFLMLGFELWSLITLSLVMAFFFSLRLSI
jgi:nitrate reductase NapE component